MPAPLFTKKQREWLTGRDFFNLPALCVLNFRSVFPDCTLSDKQIWQGWKFYNGYSANISAHTYVSYLKKPVGTERIDKDGYIRVVVEPGKERPKHHVIWEKQGNTLEKGETLFFLNGDRTDCSISNLRKTKKKYIGAYNKLLGIVGTEITQKQREILLLCAEILVENKQKKREIKSKSTRATGKAKYIDEFLILRGKGFTKRQIAAALGKDIGTITEMELKYEAGYYR